MNRKKRKQLKIRSKHSLIKHGIDPKGNSTITSYYGKVLTIKEFMEAGYILKYSMK